MIRNYFVCRYRQDEGKAKSESNAGRVRRLGRICKQYEDAIKLHSAGRPVPFAELPTPPGFGPIPATVDNPPKAALTAAAAQPPQPPPTAQRQFSRDDPIQVPENEADIPPADNKTFGAPPPPNTVMEALTQRLER